LRKQGKLDESIVEYREAIRLKPDDADAHTNLGVVLGQLGKLEEAIVEYREAIRLKPDDALAHANLGIVLHQLGKLEESIVEYREAIRLKPDDAAPHANLGNVLRQQGKLEEAMDAIRHAAQLAPPGSAVAQFAREMVPALERQIDVARRLPAVLNGEDEPQDAGEAIALARLCAEKGLHAAAARFWSEALAADPQLADEPRGAHRYNAACSAALAASGKGDGEALGDEQRVALRKQALDWLRADLTLWTSRLDSATAEDRRTILKNVEHWQRDPDLAGIRDAESRALLSAQERQTLEQLWADIEALLTRDDQPAPK
jgi:Flp pilus assembly protein TadD